jgi:hypothetical protein
MAPKYQYDLMKDYATRGRARMDCLDEIRKIPNRPDRVTPKKTWEKAKVISKSASTTLEIKSEGTELSGKNQHLCRKCQRLFDGMMDIALPISKAEEGLYFLHWDFRYLQKAAALGCPICLLVVKDLGENHLALNRGEVVPGRCDVGRYMGCDDAYALSFYYYFILRRDDDVVLVLLGPVVLTL